MNTWLFHNIGERRNSNYNTLEEILALPKEDHLTFDGLYKSVYDFRYHLMGRKITIFVCGDHVGKNNAFDSNCGMPNFKIENFANWNEIAEFCKLTGATLGWHSKSHGNLCEMTDEQIKSELTPPFYMKTFAYPYGNVDSRVERFVKEAGFEDAYSVVQGNNTQFQKNRKYLNW